ncbi:hypothetical protein [Coleofasciculus sp. LEGE 07092]|nr:hypothetical protein [Coleofasciculus sp. LEGE 07092]MBE9152277.1 hypothetical protein [Coleofasciculus sp. LEGE 07092]
MSPDNILRVRIGVVTQSLSAIRGLSVIITSPAIRPIESPIPGKSPFHRV